MPRKTRRPQASVRRASIESAPASAASDHKRVLALGLAVYLAVMMAMVAFDSYAFVLKSTVVPFLLLAALVSRRFSGFVNDWAVFLATVVLFDSLRSLVFAATTHFELPMYAGYAIAWERLLCGGAIAPVLAQQLRATLAQPLWLDRLFVLLHASHFLFFFLFGFILWLVRRDGFRTYAAAVFALFYLALLVMLLVPTIPPWLAARDFLLLPPIEKLISNVYNVTIPELVAIFDINPIAAMPSLHCAMPTLCALLAAHYMGRRVGAAVGVYAVGVWLAVIYLGEHYLVDVVAGVLLALTVYAGVRRWGAPAIAPPTPRVRGPEPFAARAIIVALLLAASSFAFGQLATVWLGPLPITKAFVERELIGRSQLAHYLLGRVALDAGDYAEAKLALTRALDDLPAAEHQRVIRSLLDRSELTAK